MNIVVCTKQVPDTDDIKWTENNTLSREGVESIINPYDTYALEAALTIKDIKSKLNPKIDIIPEEDTIVTTISMGPKQAINMLKETIACGADNSFLLSDKAFAGSDTNATAKVLSKAIKEKIPNFDLILCGQQAIDGDTAQTGPSIAQNLNIAMVSNVKTIKEVQKNFLLVEKIVDDGYELLQVFLPAVVCMTKSRLELRLPKIANRIKAQDTEIPIYTAEDINIDPETIGFKGSPTYVKRTEKPQSRKCGEILKDKTEDEFANFILRTILGAKN